MNPGLQDGQVLCLKRYNKEKDKIEKGMLVVYKEKSTGSLVVKRAIATAGDMVKLDGGLFVNDKLVAQNIDTERQIEIKIPEGYFFLLGDNYSQSEDSLRHLIENKEYLISVDDILGIKRNNDNAK